MFQFASVLLLVLSSAAPADEDEAWAGRWVFPKKQGLSLANEDGKELFKLSDYARVTWAGKKDWVMVRHNTHPGPYEGYLMKQDLVKLADAPGYFTDRIRENEKDEWAWRNRAAAWTLKGEHDNAIKDLTELIRLSPSQSSYISRGNAWNSKGEYDKAIKDYDEAVRLDSKDSVAFYNRGRAWFENKDYDKAIKDYDEAIRLEPKQANAFNARGNAWREKKVYDKAIEDLDEAVRLDPNYALPFRNRGLTWTAKRNYDRAIKDFDEMIRLDPNDALVFGFRGAAWYQKRENDRAIKDFDEAIRLDPKSPRAFNSRGHAYRSKKDYDQSIKDHGEALRLDPSEPTGLWLRARAWIAKREYAKALQDCDEAVKIAPKRVEPIYTRAVIAFIRNESGCIADFERVIEMSGESEYAAFARITGALSARRANDKAAEKRFLQEPKSKTAERWPSPILRYLRGEIDEKELLKSSDSENEREEARFFLGLDLLTRDHKEDGIAHLRWVKEHGNPALYQYDIAIAELDRLEKDKK